MWDEGSNSNVYCEPMAEYEIVDFDYYAPSGLTVTPEILYGPYNYHARAGEPSDMDKYRVAQQVKFNVNADDPNDWTVWTKKQDIQLYSLTVKVNMKGYDDVYTYLTLIFNNHYLED